MNYSKYYEARDIVKEILEKDLLGPIENEEIISEYPITYYIAGKLYPQECQIDIEKSSSEDIGDTEEEQMVSLNSGRVPSSMGISFSLSNEANTISISVKTSIYSPIEEFEGDKKRILWKRIPICMEEQSVNVNELLKMKRIEYSVHENLKLILMIHKIYSDNCMTVTASLVNTCKQSERETRHWINQHTYFQPEIIVTGDKSFFRDIRRNAKIDINKDIRELEMLYSGKKNYVTGHGCAANYTENANLIILKSLVLPVYELNQMMPAQHSEENILSMKYLSELNMESMISELNHWIDSYKLWIDDNYKKINSLEPEHHEIANENMDKCMNSYLTIKKSISCMKDPNVYRAFSIANEAMFIQRKQNLINKNISFEDEQIKWYPFQLAFFLQEIISFAEVDSEERKKVDLLWFPTGGGKTEAYLGISAFVIFLRRFRNKARGSGVSIIMRYTLRLLTFQQFERASALICACELLRKKYGIPGDEISIGLWAGIALTPNSLEKAKKILEGYPDQEYPTSNPKQLEKCPWCGCTISDEDYTCDLIHKKMVIRCSDSKCYFHKGLPVYLVDEEIYVHTPTFLVATVDKFAQVAHNEKTFSLFGYKGKNIPPELIIQDELHLISGPLGTITGIYEAAFKKMFTYNDINAKVIASTATIKNAKEQINSLYASDFTQFPPQGIDAEDSYFAIKSTKNEKPARMYMGCLGTGTSATTIMIRVMAATLFATRYLETLDFDEEIIDSFWTITSYFNTLRELGGAIVRVVDNVQDRYQYLKETKFRSKYVINGGQKRYDQYIELTSREKSENIGKIIQKDLLIKYSKTKNSMPYDFILSSNMISVGIDIARLNTMLVVGQPKTTAEYIQATSRVGRETPGFVFTMYNYMRSRDKSHFEQFCQYHEAFYKYVEATSVTPFAERSRDRALQTLYIILCRYFIDELYENSSAGKYNRNIPGLEMIRNYILDYVEIVDPDEYENVLEEINEIEEEWERLAYESPNMTFRKEKYQKDPALYSADYDENSRFRVLNSVRSVETSVQVITRE